MVIDRKTEYCKDEHFSQITFKRNLNASPTPAGIIMAPCRTIPKSVAKRKNQPACGGVGGGEKNMEDFARQKSHLSNNFLIVKNYKPWERDEYTNKHLISSVIKISLCLKKSGT